jgi:soluble epoxide hydrolase / lipid-phosphate phosphatase
MFVYEQHEVASGINYEYVHIKASDASKATVLFLHGFPSSLYCWRHQLKFFGEHGYGCLAPNLMGYGNTFSPSNNQQYRTKNMTEHLVALLDHLHVQQVLVVGHDWGVRVASRFVLHHADRTLGLVCISVGYTAPRRLHLEQVLLWSKRTLGYENIGYWKFFGSDDAAALIENNIESFIDLGYPSRPDLWATDFAPLGKIRDWLTANKRCERAAHLTDDDCAVLRRVAAEGIQTKLNWYKSAIDNVDWPDEQELDPVLRRPVLFIGGSKDYICLPSLFAEQGTVIPDLTSVELDATHWIMEEKPDDVNRVIAEWIVRFH